jgi:hypothetical protein
MTTVLLGADLETDGASVDALNLPVALVANIRCR